MSMSRGGHCAAQGHVCGCPLLLVLLCTGRPRTQLFLNRSHEKTDSLTRDRTCPSRTCWRLQGKVGQRVNLQGCSLSLVVGPHQEMEPTHNFTAELLGKPGGITQLQCVWLRPGTRHLPRKAGSCRCEEVRPEYRSPPFRTHQQ